MLHQPCISWKWEEVDKINYSNSKKEVICLMIILQMKQIEQMWQPILLCVVPFVIGTVVRLVTQWVGKQAVKTVSKHDARAVQRGISLSAFAKAMVYGTKYVIGS